MTDTEMTDTEYIIKGTELDYIRKGANDYEMEIIESVESRSLSEAIQKHNVDVIKKLEELKAERKKSKDFGMNFMVLAYDVAITLIRDGVK
jgi:hypothetical protein